MSYPINLYSPFVMPEINLPDTGRIFHPKRTKVKGYQRDQKGKFIRK